jgi:phytoene dehydrogenase-like protein
MNGYVTTIFEHHTLPGGLCTAWKREGYTIDGCIHWLVGSSPESGMHRAYDALWVVTAPREVQIARLVSTRALSEAEASLRIDAQPPQAEKAVLADVVIVNDGSFSDLQRQVESAWAAIRKE